MIFPFILGSNSHFAHCKKFHFWSITEWNAKNGWDENEITPFPLQYKLERGIACNIGCDLGRPGVESRCWIRLPAICSLLPNTDQMCPTPTGWMSRAQWLSRGPQTLTRCAPLPQAEWTEHTGWVMGCKNVYFRLWSLSYLVIRQPKPVNRDDQENENAESYKDAILPGSEEVKQQWPETVVPVF